ncbi:MAG: hypothetical protein LKE55_05805 [Prevotella sp.]|nr:hypothetical protein [Prevotella sp.]
MEKFEAEVNKEGHCRCFVHRSVFYEKARHGVRKIEKPSISGFVFLQGSTKFLRQYLHEHYPFPHLIRDHNTRRSGSHPRRSDAAFHADHEG